MERKKRGPKKGSKLTNIKRSKIGSRIFSARRARGMSQLELGEKTGLTLRTISYYERESDNIPAPVLKKIAEALIVTTNYLIGESSLKIPGDDSPFALRKAFDKLKKLPKKNQKAIIQMIDALDVKNRVAVDNEGR